MGRITGVNGYRVSTAVRKISIVVFLALPVPAASMDAMAREKVDEAAVAKSARGRYDDARR
jgi:hypothetical protein